MLKLEYKGHPVLTTDQIATILGTNPYRIQDNYRANKDNFDEGKHFFKVTGDQLKAAKELGVNVAGSSNQLGETQSVLRLIEEADAADVLVPEPTIGLRAASLMLWTRRGVARHAKLLTTEESWRIYEQMEDVYFHVLEGKQPELKEAPKAEALKVSRAKYWRGRRVWTTKEVLALMPGLTKDKLRHVTETILTGADTMVLRGFELRQFKKDNGNCSTGKSLRVFTDDGLTKIGAYYNVSATAVTVVDDRITKAVAALQAALQALTA